MSTFKQDHDALEARVEKEQQAAMDAQALYQLFSSHRELVPVDSNRAALVAYFAGEPMSLASLEEALTNPALRKQLAFLTPEADRAKLLQNLKEVSGEVPSRFAETEAIRSKLEEIERRKEMEKKSVPELKALIKQNAPIVEQDDLPVSHTRASLLALNGGEFKRICDRYGVANVTRALNTRR